VDLVDVLDLAARHHEGQTDQAGRPYMGHIHRVVAAVTTPDQKLAAALHDFLEDTDVG
jgi:GTP diphosphokinase / guanosine-3',5'-bis(diphosphate) 3'-diphosphatase